MNKAEELIACLEGEIAKRDARIGELEGIVDKAWNRSHQLEHGAYIPGALDAWKRPVLQNLPYDFSGNPGTPATQYCNGWNDAGGYWKAHVDDLLAELAAIKSTLVAKQVVMPERREPSQDNPYLSEADIEWNSCLDEVARLNAAPVQQAKCVHTEHCCVDHGCKYGHDDCPVVSGLKNQSYPCESCAAPAAPEADAGVTTHD